MKKMNLLMILLAFTLMLTGCGTDKDYSKDYSDEIDLKSNMVTSPPENTVEKITDEEAVLGVEQYCYEAFPDLKEGLDAGTYSVSWSVETSENEKAVVLFYSYTGSELRFYIDRASGETYVTEYMPGLSSAEEDTGVTFDIKDYIPETE